MSEPLGSTGEPERLPAPPVPSGTTSAPGTDEADRTPTAEDPRASGTVDASTGETGAEGERPRPRRRRGSRGGRNRNRSRTATGPAGDEQADDGAPPRPRPPRPAAAAATDVELPDPPGENEADDAVAPVPAKPRIGDVWRPPPGSARTAAPTGGDDDDTDEGDGDDTDGGLTAPRRRRRRRGGRGRGAGGGRADEREAVLDEETLAARRGRERKGRPVGRYLMAVHVRPDATQIAVLEGRSLIEHYVSRPQDDVSQIDGNIYLGRVQNVLPGMEAAFVDIGTPKNAVLYRGDVRYDKDDVVAGGEKQSTLRIEQLLKPGQTVLCQVTKNPIGAKGARLTQEVSIPGRFVVLVPNSDTYGISKRLADEERKRLRRVLDEVKPQAHGLIVRTAAEGATADELRRDVQLLVGEWERIEAKAKRAQAPVLLYREPDLAVRVIREEFNKEYRSVAIDDRDLYDDVKTYVGSISPELADRVEFADPATEPLPLFERHHVHEQLHKALDRKVWLPSGGSLIIERTEALTVIDVNTGKNVGTSNLEETVYRNNLEAAEEIARQLRLRDIGGIIVIDFIDMEIAANRNDVMRSFRDALARDKTRTQVFDMSELGIVQMTRKRISEGLVESFSTTCPHCNGRGFVLDQSLL